MAIRETNVNALQILAVNEVFFKNLLTKNRAIPAILSIP